MKHIKIACCYGMHKVKNCFIKRKWQDCMKQFFQVLQILCCLTIDYLQYQEYLSSMSIFHFVIADKLKDRYRYKLFSRLFRYTSIENKLSI